MVGGFVLGLVIPHGELAIKTMETVEAFVNGIMLPAFVLLNGLRTNLRDIHEDIDGKKLTLVTIAATSAKIVSTVLIYLYYGMPSQDGLVLGCLMNTKGVLALIVLNEGRSLQAMDSIDMLSMVMVVLVMTFLVGPIFFLIHQKDKAYQILLSKDHSENAEDGILTVVEEMEREKDLDDGFINDFRFKTMCDETITYYEKQVNDCSETVESIIAMCKNFDLYIDGRGCGVKSPLTKGLSEWSENPELGPIEDTLGSSEFTGHASVLVVQQSATGHKGNIGQRRWA
ncbi:Cation/H(+) antiporter like [Melia azedarach]|uniref:Cation/H(+) antiporter like n=1 Tax=Melia azedarach TaxID=155640 RepID=A0ACC1YPJ0_MELAZ|nr:Cation/H(+) antiporter like [Melia azedarach]